MGGVAQVPFSEICKRGQGSVKLALERVEGRQGAVPKEILFHWRWAAVSAAPGLLELFGELGGSLRIRSGYSRKTFPVTGKASQSWLLCVLLQALAGGAIGREAMGERNRATGTRDPRYSSTDAPYSFVYTPAEAFPLGPSWQRLDAFPGLERLRRRRTLGSELFGAGAPIHAAPPRHRASLSPEFV